MKKNKYLIILVFILIGILYTALTITEPKLYTTDSDEYLIMAEYFSDGTSNVQLFNPHSILYSFLVGKISGSLYSELSYKFIGTFFLFGIALALYLLTKKVLAPLLFLLNPITIGLVGSNNPIIPGCLLFLLGYYYLTKWTKENKFVYLCVSGILIGLSCGLFTFFVLFAIILLFFVFLEKKLKFLLIILIFIILGLAPSLILEHYYFGFGLHSMTRIILAEIGLRLLNVVNVDLNQTTPIALISNDFLYFMEIFLSFCILTFISVVLFIFPLKRLNFKENKREFLFIIFVILWLFILGGHLAYTILIIPIIILLYIQNYKDTDKKFIAFFILMLIITSSVTTYIAYKNSETEKKSLIKEDIIQIKEDFKKEFILGPNLYYITKEFDDTYKFWWWDEYQAELNDQEYYRGYIFKEMPKLSAQSIISFEVQYQRNYPPLPEEQYFIFEESNIQKGFKEIKCYKVLCVYKGEK